MFALISSPSLFKGRGWGMGPDLPIQNYMDIGKIDVAEQNLSTREVPRPGLRGGVRGGVPIEGARIFQFLRRRSKNLPQGKILLLPNGRRGAARLKRRRKFRRLRTAT